MLLMRPPADAELGGEFPDLAAGAGQTAGRRLELGKEPTLDVVAGAAQLVGGRPNFGRVSPDVGLRDRQLRLQRADVGRDGYGEVVAHAIPGSLITSSSFLGR